MAASAIWNYGVAAANPRLNTHPMSTAQNTAAGSGDEASISANDFLTLLVTEMKNQDPTAATDPNAYINQLVQVNSLEQLISINQTLATALGVSGSSESVSSISPIEESAQSPHSTRNAAAVDSASRVGTANFAVSARTAVPNARTHVSSGNLGVPDAIPAARQVAQALSGHSGGQ